MEKRSRISGVLIRCRFRTRAMTTAIARSWRIGCGAIALKSCSTVKVDCVPSLPPWLQKARNEWAPFLIRMADC